MRTPAVYAVLVGLSCSSFEGFEPSYQQPTNWGYLTVLVVTRGERVGPSLGNTYQVALDSAVSGYGLRSITTNVDTVQIDPVLAGSHTVTLRKVKPHCTVQNGTERAFVVLPNVRTEFNYLVTCTPVDSSP